MKRLLSIYIILTALIILPSSANGAARVDSIFISYESPTTSAATVYFSGAAPFTIYRSEDGNNWGAAIASGLNADHYQDNNLENLKNYYYKVQDSVPTSAIGAAYPPNNNVHSSLRQETSYFCASCHITHAAEGAFLLIEPTVVSLCTTCHDGSQSKYDVRSGKLQLPNGSFADTSGGPFGPLKTTLPVELKVYAGFESLSESVVSAAYYPTSIHNLGTAISQAPGGVSDVNQGLSCVDCHDPHGITGNFRNLKSLIRVTDSVSVPIDFKAFARTDSSLTTGYGEDIYYDTGSIYFCSACHSDYNQAKDSGSKAASTTQVSGLNLSAGAHGDFIHAVNTPLIFRSEYYTSALPLEQGTGINVVVCLTCHQAHGTVKTGINRLTGSTALIRMDRQGICEECHKK